MERKKRGLELFEALEFLEATAPKLKEATVAGNYPDDGTGIATDDDRPPGNIVYGEKYKRTPYFNRLTSFQDSWENDPGEWKWDEFENSMGMEDFENYSDTLNGMRNLFTKKQWRDTWKRMKNVPDDLVTKRFKQSGQPWRKGGEDQLGKAPEIYVDIKVNKVGDFDTDLEADKEAEQEKHFYIDGNDEWGANELVKKIDDITL